MQAADKGWKRRGWTALAVLMFVGSSMTVRRQVPINIGVGLVSLLFLTEGPTRRIVLGTLVIGALVAFLVLYPSRAWQDRLGESLSGRDDPRLVLVDSGLKAWSSSPLVGHGLENFEEATLAANGPALSRLGFQEKFDSHNSFVWLLVEGGILGLAGLAAFLWGIAWTLFKTTKRSADPYVVALNRIMPAVFLQLLIFLWFSSAIRVNSVWFFFALLVAAAIVRDKGGPAENMGMVPAPPAF